MFDFFSRRHKHTQVPQRDSESLDSDTLLLSSSSSTADAKSVLHDRSSRDLEVAVRTFVLTTVIYLGLAVWVVFSVRQTSFVSNPDDFCLHHIARYSPVLKEVKPNWHTKLFNGTFLHENVYRQAVGPDVDTAWEALGVNYRSVVIAPEDAEESGLRQDQVKISQEYGGGFPANVEGLHHLHCLNLLRKTLHWNYDYYLAKKDGPFVNSEYIVRLHATHCLDIIRQVLMCTPDVGVLGQVWWQPENEPRPMAFVDFNTKHQCRDYEAIRAWAEAHQLPPEKEVNMSHFYEMPKPGDMVYSAIP